MAQFTVIYKGNGETDYILNFMGQKLTTQLHSAPHALKRWVSPNNQDFKDQMKNVNPELSEEIYETLNRLPQDEFNTHDILTILSTYEKNFDFSNEEKAEAYKQYISKEYYSLRTKKVNKNKFYHDFIDSINDGYTREEAFQIVCRTQDVYYNEALFQFIINKCNTWNEVCDVYFVQLNSSQYRGKDGFEE